MIDLYAAPTSNGMRARIALEECALPYTLHPIALDKGENRTPEFLRMNPNGQIPVIVDRDGPGGKPLTLSQSSAILLYCAEKSGRFLPANGAARAAALQAMMSASTDITPTLGAIVAVSRSKDAHALTAQMFKDRLTGYFRVWDAKLAGQKCCAGGEVTVADLSLYAGYWRAMGAMPEIFQGFANLARWAGEMSARPAIQRAVNFPAQ